MSPGSTSANVSHNNVCCKCACFCDDISISVKSGAIVEAKNACSLGESFFINSSSKPNSLCLLNGKPISFENAVDFSVNALMNSRNPLIHGLVNCVSEAQQIACRLAKTIDALVDINKSETSGYATEAFQSTGGVTCTYGESKNRSELFIYIGADPLKNQPRHFERFGIHSEGRFTKGLKKRKCVVIDHGQNETGEVSDQYLNVAKGSDLCYLLALRAVANGVPVDSKMVEIETGIAFDTWQTLVNTIISAAHVSIFTGERFGKNPIGFAEIEALHKLVLDLNKHTRVFIQSISGQHNLVGAELVASWLTGFPSSIRFRNANPENFSEEFSTSHVLCNAETDAVMSIGETSIERLGNAERRHIESVPRISIGHYNGNPHSTAAPHIHFETQQLGIGESGTIYRNDKVPLPIRNLNVSNAPSTANVLQAILDSIQLKKDLFPSE